MDKKGQAAMEFLMTYGWAILAAIIAIGVLYLIIGNPANLVGDRYTVNTPFVVGAAAAHPAGVTLDFKNGKGEAITVTKVDVGTACTTGTISIVVPIDGIIAPQLAACTLVVGDRIKGDITISYTTTSSSVPQTGTGSVNLKVT
jgi:uncharacterized protein (UPF0333 family)